MRQKSETRGGTPEQIVKDIRRATRKHHSAEEKIRIVLEGAAGRVQHRRALSAGGHCREPVLQLVKGVPGSREEAPGGRYGPVGNQR